MSAPQSIEEVLAGPHVHTLIHDGAVAIVMVEPLRFIPLTQIRGYCPRCGEVPPCLCDDREAR